ncbi:MAG: transcriptional regulator [Spirochaetes bacterium GWC2_52_13]|nr:MAG: transcriptional regulator [Spirochaetes bacterium GWC2_52_13]HCG62602.1 transcriptional regulator [Sphaerochaeta sp.]
MLSDKNRNDLVSRLRRIEGQVGGIRNMIEEDRYCIDVLNQTSAVISAIRKVEDLILHNHLNTCVSDAMQSGDQEVRLEKTSEIMSIVSRIRK